MLVKFKRAQRITSEEESILDQAHTYWLERCGYEARPGPKRYRLILGLVRNGFTLARLKAIIDRASKDPWAQGANNAKKRFDDPVFLFRDVPTAEGWEAKPTMESRKDSVRETRLSPTLAPHKPGEKVKTRII